MAKQKYYVVWEGKQKGVFHQWKECEKQIKGFQGAKYKSFPSLALAEEAFKNSPAKYIYKTAKKNTADNSNKTSIGFPDKNTICVDAACSGNPGLVEYRGVYTKTEEEIFHKGPFQQGTNNVGEFLALVHGLAYLKQKNINLPIYSDSVNAIKWVKNKKVNTKLKQIPKNKILFDLIERALFWLNNNEYSTKILKWETKVWGEIPADFGRK